MSSEWARDAGVDKSDVKGLHGRASAGAPCIPSLLPLDPFPLSRMRYNDPSHTNYCNLSLD